MAAEPKQQPRQDRLEFTTADARVKLIKRSYLPAWIRRLVGKMVSPVLADPTIKRSDLPAWDPA
jgi:hypothetical protein